MFGLSPEQSECCGGFLYELVRASMIERQLRFALPPPWHDGEYVLPRIGSVNFLVGPNGSGKSRFANALRVSLGKCRLLGTDRLQGMERDRGLGFMGDHFNAGFQKNQFTHIKRAGDSFGSGLDTFILLEERLDLRIRVESTLSHLFNRKIYLEWDSGNLLAKASVRSGGATYRLDSEECHGIKELLVLLTHLYNEEYEYLIVDEPELHLHPQFQSFFIQEVRKVAGNPHENSSKKAVFLVTHSPFMLDFQTTDDLRSVISFKGSHELPRQIGDIDDAALQRISSLIPRLNVHHKQLFFSDHPIFVEGIFDAQMVQFIQDARGVSVSGAGSCIIDAGGNEEVNAYLELCAYFGKEAYFLYDLDSLYSGRLRRIADSNVVDTSFLTNHGLGSEFRRYCGELDRLLTDNIKEIRSKGDIADPTARLVSFLDTLSSDGSLSGDALARARVAFLVHLRKYRDHLSLYLPKEKLADIQGRFEKIVEVLREHKIFILPGGALEHYLPNYNGSIYSIDDSAKKTAVQKEIIFLSGVSDRAVLTSRYGDFYEAICMLPAQEAATTENELIRYVADYIHDVQGLAVENPEWQLAEIEASIRNSTIGIEQLIVLGSFHRTGPDKFTAKLDLVSGLNDQMMYVRFSESTNAGMRAFELSEA